MYTLIFRLTILLCCVCASPAIAETREAEIVNRFSSFCIEPHLEFTAIEKKASTLNLRVLKENTPDAGEEKFFHSKTWQLPGSAGTYVLIASELVTKADTFTTCQVFAGDAKGSEMRKTVESRIQFATPDSDSLAPKDPKKRQITWSVNLAGEVVLVRLLHPEPDGQGVNLSLTRKSKGKPELLAQTKITGPVECSVRVFQNGKEVLPNTADKIPSYKLAVNNFRIEVSPRECNPSITLADRNQIDYLTQTPVVFSDGGYWGAGDIESADMLALGGIPNDVSTIIEKEVDTTREYGSWVQQQYRNICNSLGYCPTPAKTYATAWPFLDPETKKNRGYAEFKRLDEKRSLSDVSERVILAVIYSEWKTVSKDERTGFYLLKPHVVAFDFRSSTLKPVPSDLTKLPNIGVEKDDAIKFLGRLVQFSEQKEKYGLSLLSGASPDGKIKIAFKMANTTVVAGSIAVPDSSQQDYAALKAAMLILFMRSLVPEVNWEDPNESSSLGEAVAKATLDSKAGFSRKIGEKFIFAVRDPQTGLIKFGVINVSMTTDRYDIGKF